MVLQEGEFEWPALAPLLDKLEGVHWSSAGDKQLMIQSLEQTFDTDHSGAGSCCCRPCACVCTAVSVSRHYCGMSLCLHCSGIALLHSPPVASSHGFASHVTIWKVAHKLFTHSSSLAVLTHRLTCYSPSARQLLFTLSTSLAIHPQHVTRCPHTVHHSVGFRHCRSLGGCQALLVSWSLSRC